MANLLFSIHYPHGYMLHAASNYIGLDPQQIGWVTLRYSSFFSSGVSPSSASDRSWAKSGACQKLRSETEPQGSVLFVEEE
jgi:hypothetical protein